MFDQILEEYNNKCKEDQKNYHSGFRVLSIFHRSEVLNIIEGSGVNELINKSIESSLFLNTDEVEIQKQLNVAIDKKYNKIWKLRTIEQIIEHELSNLKKEHRFIILAYLKDYELVLNLYDIVQRRENL